MNYKYEVTKNGIHLSFHWSLGKAKDRIDSDCVLSLKPLVFNDAKYEIVQL